MVVGWSIKSETAIFGLRKEWKLSRPFGRAESVPGLAWNILSKLNCGGQWALANIFFLPYKTTFFLG